MPVFYYLPKAVLAAVVITSVMFLVEYEEIKPMWKSRSTNFNFNFKSFLVKFADVDGRGQCLEHMEIQLFLADVHSLITV